MTIVDEDDDIKERRSISDAEMEKRLVKEREMWERQKQREMREKGSSRRSRSRSRSPVGWLQRAVRGGREAGARGGRGAGRGGGRAGGSGLQHADYIPNLSSGHEEGITSKNDADTRKWKEAERKKKKKDEQKREEREGVQVMVPVNILKEVMPVYLKEGFSTMQAIFAVAKVLLASGADLDKFVISIGSCHRLVVETRETISEILLSSSPALDCHQEDVVDRGPGIGKPDTFCCTEAVFAWYT